MESSEHNTNTQENTGTSLQISDAIDRLLANPELLSTVASAIGVQNPTNTRYNDKETESNSKINPKDEKSNDILDDTSAESVNTNAKSNDISSKLPDIMANAAPILSALSGNGKLPNDDRTRLLCALKPYVNSHRREAIDTIVNLARISEVIKTIK